MKEITIKAPARICLYGDHQDYLGLPVIAAAVNRYIQLEAKENGKNYLQVEMPDLNQERRIDLSDRFGDLDKRDYLASGIRCLRKQNIVIDRGYDIRISGNIPINAGASSSSAFVSAWMLFLMAAFSEVPDKKTLSLRTYGAESLEHGEPGGKMDQLTISTGGIIYINTQKDYDITRFEHQLDGLILANSAQPKDTLGLLSRVSSRQKSAIAHIQSHTPSFDPRSVSEVEFKRYQQLLDKESQVYFEAAIKNYQVTQSAFNELNNNAPNIETLLNLMNRHQEYLGRFLKVSTEKINWIIDEALKSGAKAAKTNGSGGGGSVVIWAPGESKNVTEHLNSLGIDAYSVEIDEGTRIVEKVE